MAVPPGAAQHLRPWSGYHARFLVTATLILVLLATGIRGGEAPTDPLRLPADATRINATTGLTYTFTAPGLAVQTLTPAMRQRLPWHASSGPTLHLKFNAHALWLRIPLHGINHDDWLLAIDSPSVDSATTYWLPSRADGAPQLLGKRGDHRQLPVSRRDRIPLFDLPDDKRQGTLLVRLRSTSALMLSATLWQSSVFQHREARVLAALGAVFGILAVMALYNLGVWLFVRDTAYLFYVGYTLSAGTYVAALTGFGRQFFWGNWIWACDNLYWLCAMSSFIFGTLFVDRFLDLRHHNPIAHRIASVIVLVYVVLTGAYALLPEAQVAATGWGLGIASSAMAWILAAVEWRRGTPGARYFAVAWSFLLLGTCIYILFLAGVLPDNAFTGSAQIAGMTCEVVLLSLALGDRFKRLRRRANRATEAALQLTREINQAHAEKLRLQEEATLRLESEVRARTRALAQAKARAEQADHQKTRFLAAASHDIRQPLHALSLMTETLPGGPGDLTAQDLPKTSQHIRQAVDQLVQLFDMLFDLSRLDNQRVVPAWQPLALAPFLERLGNHFRPLCAQAGVTLHVDIAADVAPSTTRSDPVLLQRILLILVDNALQHARCEHVRLSLSSAGDDTWVLAVSDDGQGIPIHEQNNIFEEFYQLQNPERSRQKGMGLGLALCQRLVQLLSCRLALVSDGDQGSRFNLHLAATEERASETITPPAAIPDPLMNLRVLVVDDDAMAGDALAHLLQRWGADCQRVANGVAACELISQSTPDLAILDYRLPGSDNGVALAQRLRDRLGPDFPILIMTGDIELERPAPSLPVLHKPIRPSILRAALLQIQNPVAQ